MKEQRDKVEKEFNEKVVQLKQAQDLIVKIQQELLVLQGKYQMLEELDKEKEKKK